MSLPCLKGGVSRRLTEGFMYGIINILTYSDKIPVNLVIRYSDNREFSLFYFFCSDFIL